jgi:hypothetical protein
MHFAIWNDYEPLWTRGRISWFGYEVSPQKVHVLGAWSLAGGVILRDLGNFRR